MSEEKKKLVRTAFVPDPNYDVDAAAAEIVNMFNRVKDVIDDIENDLAKNARGGTTAGARLRKSFREIKALATNMQRTSSIRDKNVLARKKLAKEQAETP